MTTLPRCLILTTLVLCGCGPVAPTPAPNKVAADPAAPSENAILETPVALQAPKATRAAAKQVTLLRTPDGGIQPQAVMHSGVLHLIYFKGEARAGDVFYVKSSDEGQTFSKPLRVNSVPGSVVAAGNVRGAHLAIGTGGRTHVAWMGSMKTAPKGDHHLAPMLYARLNEAGDAFEPQRNLIDKAYGLDGGGSVAAEGDKVCVAWHAPTPGTKGEENRRVWLRTSLDGGQTFGNETPISPADAGSCGCCGMRVFAGHPGQILALFRGARENVNRDMFLITADVAGKASATKLEAWEVGTCPMSTMAFARAGDGPTFLAWETDGQVSYARLKPGDREPSKAVAAPGKGGKRRHPALAASGQAVLLAWTEGMGWNKGGSLAWQLYDAKNDAPVINAKLGDYGRADGVPVWSLLTAVALPDRRFAIIY